MVKNKNGGNRHKKMARKNVKTQFTNRKIRKPKEEEEMFAKVEKMFGGGHADVICNDGVNRLLVIRKKFSGRNKRDNHIKDGTYLLVGKRNWEIVALGKKEKVDLLEVYRDTDITELKKSGFVFTFDKSENKDDGNIEFTNEEEITSNIVINMDNDNNKKINLGDEEVNWDDI